MRSWKVYLMCNNRCYWLYIVSKIITCMCEGLGSMMWFCWIMEINTCDKGLDGYVTTQIPNPGFGGVTKGKTLAA